MVDGLTAAGPEPVPSSRPLTLAIERLLPVPPALEPLLPAPGLRRGSTIAVTGSTALALTLVAAASAAGSWVGAVALPDLGVLAAAEAGVVLERLVLVPAPGGRWGAVVAALLDAVDVVMAGCPGRPRAAEARGLAARARQRDAVLVPVGGGWPEPADLAMTVVAARWEGLGQGAGHLVRRRVEVVASGRGAAARERRAVLWLPG